MEQPVQPRSPMTLLRATLVAACLFASACGADPTHESSFSDGKADDPSATLIVVSEDGPVTVMRNGAIHVGA